MDGPHTAEVMRVLGRDISSANSLESIKSRAAQIVQRAVDPFVGPPSTPSDGLLYGLIQSGKTSIITAAVAMAADNGFQCVAILTADIDVLYDQTLDRVRRALRGLSVLGKNDWRDAQRFQAQLENTPFVVVCSKNSSKLQGLLDAFRKAKAGSFATIIIDDEADQASLNTYTSKGGTQISKINEVITAIRDYFPTNTYLQVTATPQALFLQHPSHRYRPSFTVLSEPGEGYVGGEDFFGGGTTLIRDVELTEVDHLRATNQPSPAGTVPGGLKRALLSFLVAAGAKLINDPRQGCSFLCHVSVARKDHEYIVGLIDRFKGDMLRTLRDPDTARHAGLIDDLRAAYEDLKTTEPALPQFDGVLNTIGFYLPGAKVKLINASTKEEIVADSALNIFVGGTKLGRGVTLDNLLVSYYGRNPKKPKSDTVLQHARMYGYRSADIGLTRLFLPPQLAEHFRLIHQMESGLRDIVKAHPVGHFEGLYVASPLQPTRRNVLDPATLGMYLAGGNYNPRYPLRSQQASESTIRLDTLLHRYSSDGPAHEVTIPILVELIETWEAHPDHKNELWDPKTIRAALEELESLRGPKGYVVVRRGRSLGTPRRETQGILSGGEESLAPRDWPTLFMYRQDPTRKGEVACWWPQLRFPDGNYAIAFSFNR